MFTTTTEETILSMLISQTEDSAKAYREASRERTAIEHRDMLVTRADERDRIVALLSDRMREMGSEPPRRGTILGAIGRSWAFFRAATSGTDDALLDAIAESERSLRHAFGEALDKPMHPLTRRVIAEANAIMANGVTMRARTRDMATA